jgi:hypothetical protein
MAADLFVDLPFLARFDFATGFPFAAGLSSAVTAGRIDFAINFVSWGEREKERE